MTDELQGRSAESTWREQRDEVARRNAAVRKQAQVDRRTRDGVVEDQAREGMRREREQLQALNAWLDVKRPR